MKSPLSAMILTAGLALGLSGPVAAQSTGETTSSESSGGALVTSKIVDAFTDFAGSQENAQALVAGLRSGGEITLAGEGGTGTGGRDAAGKPGTATFTSPAGPMGWGETYIALALAKDQLSSYGIDNPGPSQIAAALTGGTVSTSQLGDMQLQGVLQMRADGMGWGKIAQAQGTKLGWVVGGLKSGGASHAGLVPTSLGTSSASDTGQANGRAAAGKPATTGVTNAMGEHAAAGNAGAEGEGGSGAHGNSGHSGHGIHNAFGGNEGSGHANAYGSSKSHAVVTVTALGAAASGGAAGAGIVNAGGGHGHGVAAAGSSHGRGAGVVSAATSGAAVAGAGIVNAGGGGAGNAGVVSAAGGNSHASHGHGDHGRGHAYAHGHGKQGR